MASASGRNKCGRFQVKQSGVIKSCLAPSFFSQRDQGVVDFFRTCSPEQTEFIANRLNELDAYLLFTADSKTFDQYLLSGIPVIKEISPLDQDLLQKGFDLKLEYFCSLDSQRDFNKASQLLAGKKQEIIRRLERMQLITLFIENSLDKIVAGKAIDESIEEVRDLRKHLEHRFLKELGQDKAEFAAWTFALCLALFNGSPYRDFNQIHRDITGILLEKFDPLGTFKDFRYALSEGDLLEKCRAQITKDLETHADRIEFCYPFHREILLDILLGNNRSVLLHIVPYLEAYIENHNQPSQLKTAAVSLGRIGALDPKGIILPIMARWNTNRGQENFHRSTIGYLFEGILGSDDEIYKSYCLGKLKEMALSDDIDEQWTAIAAYKQIGLHDLEFALAELRKIQEESVKRMLKDQKFLDFVYSHTDLLDDRDVLVNLERIYEETEAILFYVRYSIVGLSILLEPIDVLEELRKWIHEGNLSSKMSVVSLFMGPGGILAELGEQAQEPSPDNKGKKEKESQPNRLLYALTNGNEPVKKMAAFLKDLYKRCFSEFQPDDKKVLKRLLFNYLYEWTLDSLSDERASNALKELILQLYKSGDDEFKDTLWDTVNRWHAPEENEAALEAFVDDVTKQLFNI